MVAGPEKDPEALVAGRRRVEAEGGGQSDEASSLPWVQEKVPITEITPGWAAGVGREDSELGGDAWRRRVRRPSPPPWLSAGSTSPQLPLPLRVDLLLPPRGSRKPRATFITRDWSPQAQA